MLIDAKCPQCNTIFEDKVIFGDDVVVCCDCNKECEIIPCFDATFRLKYDNKKDMISWGSEGYSRSQYWDKVNAQRKGNIFPMTGRK